ncbi:MAG: HNH endonuclease [Thermodesulfobacteriota bacterium]|nr:HNH endonuclease [Thermodesulfobacteriota bacterium]
MAMRISLRTSGGRGEYELAGRVRDITNNDVYNKHIFFQILPNKIIDGKSKVFVTQSQGKPRIRLLEPSARHSQILFSSLLLMPRPIRELKKTPSDYHVLRDKKYSILGINVDVADLSAGQTVLVPLDIYLGNTSIYIKKISFSERMAKIFKIWDMAEHSDDELSQLLMEHKRIVYLENISHKNLEKVAGKILGIFQTDEDILPNIFLRLTASDSEHEEESQIIVSEDGELENVESSDSDIPKGKSGIDQIIQWRKVLSRGAEGKKFSDAVKEAYDYRCAFSGQKYPKSTLIRVPGVDSAHILPWAEHKLNEITNGVCLNKVCHWAFDQGIIRFDWDGEKYLLSIPNIIKDHAKEINFDLGYFESMEGRVGEERLPANKEFWPEPQFIITLNTKLFH